MAFNLFEDRALSSIERNNPHERTLLLKRVFQEMRAELQKNQIQVDNFRNRYSAAKLAEYDSYVERMGQIFETEATEEGRESQMFATVFEGIFHRGAHAYGWLGYGSRVIKTSEYDDWKHGVDDIVEFPGKAGGTEHLAIGVDVTFSNSLKRKFKKIKEDIKNGKLPPIEYFPSGNSQGELQNVPRVVVGVEYQNLVNLCRDIFELRDTKRLAKHPFQVLQLKQMRLQLEAFADYAKAYGQNEIEDAYRLDAKIVQTILQTKSVKEGIRMGEWENDKVFQAIKEELKELEREIENLK